MIASVRQAGVLELFWRHPLSRRPHASGARAFASHFRRDADAIRVLRDLFGGARLPLNANGDGAVLARFGSAIATGRVVLLFHRSEPRHAGVNTRVLPLTGSVAIALHSRAGQIRDATEVEHWLKHASAADLEQVWEQLWVLYRKAAESATAAGIRAEVKRALDSGELVALFHTRPFIAKTVAASQSSSAPAGAAPVTSGKEEPPESNTFSSDSSPSAQATALTEAWQQGAPFCEVCERAARSRAA